MKKLGLIVVFLVSLIISDAFAASKRKSTQIPIQFSDSETCDLVSASLENLGKNHEDVRVDMARCSGSKLNLDVTISYRWFASQDFLINFGVPKLTDNPINWRIVSCQKLEKILNNITNNPLQFEAKCKNEVTDFEFDMDIERYVVKGTISIH